MTRFIYIKTFPDATKEFVEETTTDHLRIFVREPAQNNQANKRILQIVADFYTIPKNKLRIVAGHHKQQKRIEVIE